MAQKYTILNKRGFSDFDGECPCCDRNADFVPFGEGHTFGSTIKAGAKGALLQGKFAISILAKPHRNIVKRVVGTVTADGIGRWGVCPHCSEFLLVCSKCNAARRHPTEFDDRKCPNCNAKMTV